MKTKDVEYVFKNFGSGSVQNEPLPKNGLAPQVGLEPATIRLQPTPLVSRPTLQTRGLGTPQHLVAEIQLVTAFEELAICAMVHCWGACMRIRPQPGWLQDHLVLETDRQFRIILYWTALAHPMSAAYL